MLSYKKQLVFLIIGLMIFAVSFFYIYTEVKRKAVDNLNKRQLVYAQLAAYGIEQDFEHHLKMLDQLAKIDDIVRFTGRGRDLLQTFQQTSSDEIRSITRTDANGKIVYSVPYAEKLVGRDISEQDHIRLILRNHTPVLSDVFLAEQGVKAVALHVPVFRGRTFDGTLAFLISFDALAKKYLRDIKIEESGYAWMISEKGIEIYCPIPGHVGNSVLDNCRDFPDILDMAGHMMKGEKGITTYTFEQKTATGGMSTLKKQAVYMPVKIVNTFWSIVVATPQDAVLSTISGVRNQFIVIMLLLFLFFAAIAYTVARIRYAAKMERKRRQMEEGTIKSAREIHDLYNNAPCGYHSLDADGRVVRINDTELSWLGYTREELTGKPYTEFLSGASRTLFANAFAHLRDDKTVQEQEYDMLRRDGSTFPVLVTASVVTDAQGNFVMTRSMALDITERRMQEERLRESETLYRTAMENTNDGIVIGQEGKYVYVNKKLMETIGRPDETLEGRAVGELVHTDDRSILRDNHEARMKGLPLVRPNYDLRFIKPDQSIAYVNVSVVEITYQNKPALLGFIRDITRQKQMENALRESEELYRTALEATSDGVSIVQDGKYVYINQKFLDTLGFPGEDPVGKPLGMLVHRDDQEMLRNNYLRRLRGEPISGAYELRVLRPGGTMMYIDVTSVDIVYHGKPAVLSFIRDITEKKKTEDALRESEAIYRAALEKSSDGVSIIDMQEGKYLYINQRLMNTIGRPDENIIGQPVDIYIHPDDRHIGEQYLKARREGQKDASSYEIRIIKPDGAVVILAVTAVDIIYRGNPAVISFMADITDRKRAETALRDSERLYRKALEATSDGVTITDLKTGFYVYVNQRFMKTLGRPQENIVGEKADLYVHPDDIGLGRDLYKIRKKEHKDSSSYESRIIKPDGSVAVMGVTATDIVYQGKPAVIAFITDITDRKKAENDLRESEELYRTALETTSDGVTITQEGIYVYINQRMLNTIGRPDENLIGTPQGYFVHPEDWARVERAYRNRQKGDPLYTNFELRVIKPDQSVIFLHINTVKITYRGRPAILTFAIDVTDRKRAEDALRESEELYRTAVESTNDGISIIQDGKYVYANQKLLKTIGREKEGLIGLSLGSYTLADDKNMVRQHYENLIHNEPEPLSYDLRVVKPDGSVITINISSVNIMYKGRPAVISFILDVTERKKAEEALRQSEERYRTIIESIDDDYFETDIKGSITFVNRPSRWSGRSREELIGMNYHAYTTSEMAVKVNAVFKQIFQDGKPARITDYQVIRKDGSLCHLEMSVSLMRDAEGNPIGFRGISRDVTDRIKMEEERKKLTEQLYQAQKMEAIGTLAGGIAHDFNNLLMGIQGYTSIMLLEVDASHPYFDQLKAIQTLVQSGASLTKQLLGFARAGRYEVVVTDINDLISKSVNLFGRTKKEISIYEKYADNLRSVEVDRGQIEQVLLNLFVNAWQAMPGGGSLYLETENVIFDKVSADLYDLQSGPYVKLAITDTGVGMDEKTRQRIFDPFFTTKEMGRGTGLGLASAYGIIKGHGGMITAYSEKGHGTTFHIYLPASAKPIHSDTVQETELTGGRETILLVDDEEIIAEVTSRLLSELGYTILTADSGEKAIEIYEQRKTGIDLIILDMIMPGLSGGDTFDRLKALNPDVRVILSSGYSIDGKAQAIMKKGVRVFLQKPYRLNELAQKIREALSD